MVELILKGIFTGFVLSIMIGPVFFVLLETSIRKGVRAALAFDLGVFISDIVYVLIAYIFSSEIEKLTSGSNKPIIEIVGGVVFVCFGVLTFMKKPKVETKAGADLENKKTDYFWLSFKGFFLNFANPAVIFYWITVIAVTPSSNGYASRDIEMLVFACTIFITFFGIDILKIIGAKSLRPFITETVLYNLNRVVGLIFMGSAIFILFKGIKHIMYPETIV
jgi:threonine/homoserine/homoserine lactone efflux protein